MSKTISIPKDKQETEDILAARKRLEEQVALYRGLTAPDKEDDGGDNDNSDSSVADDNDKDNDPEEQEAIRQRDAIAGPELTVGSMSLYRKPALLARTLLSYEERGLPMPKKQTVSRMRIWTPGENYEMIRSGIPLPEMPDKCEDQLSERCLFLFQNRDENAIFGSKENPKWKGVFRIAPGFGYKDGEYYDPTLKHLSKCYKKRTGKGLPKNNMYVDPERQGADPEPYWVDDFYRSREMDKHHKHTSKTKKAAQELEKMMAENGGSMAMEATQVDQTENNNKKKRGRTASSSGGGQGSSLANGGLSMVKLNESAPTVIPEDGVFFFRPSGWMRKYMSEKGGDMQIVCPATALKASPAAVLAKNVHIFLGQMMTTAEEGEAPVQENEEEVDEPEVEQKPPTPQKKQKTIEQAPAPVPAPAPVKAEEIIATPTNKSPHNPLNLMTLRKLKRDFVAAQEEGPSHPLFREFIMNPSKPDPETLLNEFVTFLAASLPK